MTPFNRLATAVGAFALFALIALIAINILMRQAGWTLPSGYELAEVVIPFVSCVALLVATVSGAHVSVDLVVERVPRRYQRLIGLLVTCIAISYWLVVACAAALTALHNASIGETTVLWNISIIPFRWMWVFTAGVISILLLKQGVRLLRGTPS